MKIQKPVLSASKIPQKHKEIYVDKTKGYYYAFNPLSKKGIILLTEELLFLLSVIDNKKTITEIYQLFKKTFSYVSDDNFKLYIGFLTQSELIFFDSSPLIHAMNTKKNDSFHVWFHLTNQCNLRCTYCFVAKTNDHMDTAIVKKSIQKIFESAKENGYQKITIRLAGGEPLLQMKHVLFASELVDIYAKKYEVDAAKEIITNGVLLTEKAAELFRKYQIETTISFDGVKQGQDKNRPFADHKTGSYEYVSRGLNNAIAANILERVIVTVTNHNVKDIPAIAEYFLSKNILLNFQFFLINPQTDANIARELKVDDDVLIGYLRKTIQIARKYLAPFQIANSLIHEIHIGAPTETCGASDRTFMTVRHDGHLSNCNWELDTSIGTIHDGDVIQTYKKNAYIEPVRTIKRKITCHTCRWKYICSGCPLEFKWNKKARAPQYCNVKMTLIPEMLRLEAERLIAVIQSKQNSTSSNSHQVTENMSQA
ncbi:hypothetical protein COY16_05450 [Candidatus Roizmanbacteria bacterium CG_4_10_14_0_2_um_filter_39_13]|uniref:Radical SAM core domain-containing protein n=1 Tax=Candidatus Roizmanbacteria bacterium CG_4_10_14_0_2_um_filter_39_13 TaxID=1974825 RepID=A0A2M7TVZ4_9BACT|nr:MAG: hypothetical protein COY16_05450 [Candidatus Roizmanbacteria bacterium CG_4_10_14_0_2_um_filter_39_13]